MKSQFKKVSRVLPPTPPTSFDWRVAGAVSPVRHQGSCGSCWAFAAVAYAESKLIIDGRYSNLIDLSEQSVF